MEVLITFLLMLGIFVGLIWLGYGIAQDQLEADRAALAQQRQALDIEWQALENSRRVHDVFFQARQAMREATPDRHHKGGDRPW